MREAAAEWCERWRLSFVRALPADFSFVAEVRRADGTPAVLKLVVPEPENEHEAEGLRRWDGNGAVRVLESANEPACNALLLELVEPGTQLWELPEDEGVAIAASLLPRLWIPVEDDHPFERVAELAARWAGELPHQFEAAGRPFEPVLAEAATRAFAELGPTQGEQVLVHRDFHRGNLLAARREPWLAIDPKASVGEREFDVAWLVGDRPADARRRLDSLAAELRVDRERVRLWAVARYVLGGLWSYEDGGDGSDQIDVARQLS